jgi:hypothetical protein
MPMLISAASKTSTVTFVNLRAARGLLPALWQNAGGARAAAPPLPKTGAVTFGSFKNRLKLC